MTDDDNDAAFAKMVKERQAKIKKIPAPPPANKPAEGEAGESFLERRASANRGSAWDAIKHGGADIFAGASTLGHTLGTTFAPNMTQLVEKGMPFKEEREQIKRYSQEPTKGGFREKAIRFGTTMLPFGLAGKGASLAGDVVEAGAARFLPQQAPRFIPSATGATWQAGGPSALAAPLGTATKVLGGGAAGGAMADPEHPGRGAVAGAVTGGIPSAVGNFLRGRIGTSIGSHVFASGLTAAAIHAFHQGLGVPLELVLGAAIPGIRWHSTPSGGMVRRVGNAILDATGRMVGSIGTGVGGAAGAKIGEATGLAAKGESVAKELGSKALREMMPP